MSTTTDRMEALFDAAKAVGLLDWLHYAVLRLNIPDEEWTAAGGGVSYVRCARALAQREVTWSRICYMKS
jgi:hypothetical protein